MKTTADYISVETKQRSQMVDITGEVARIVKKSGVRDGIATVYCPHTTAAVTINENADPSVPRDIIMMLGELVPHRHEGYRHCEGNSDAHIKSTIVGCSRQIVIEDGSMQLGTWQAVFFCEFDGPRRRKVLVQVRG
jgi:secondary thiamine-phosphate synthase enzyme